MLTLGQIITATPNEVKKRSRGVRTVRLKRSSFKDGRSYYEFQTSSGGVKKKKRKSSNYATIVVLYSDKKAQPKPTKNTEAWASCTCEFFKFYCENALAKQGSSSIIHTRGYKPKGVRPSVNPRRIPMVCKHLIAVLRQLRHVPIKEKKIPMSLEIKLALPEAEKRIPA
jgi:hypothetical protein